MPSNENTIINNIPNTDLKFMLLDMINQRISFEVLKQNVEKEQLITLLGDTVCELIELIRNQDGTSREISTSCLSRNATTVMDDIIANDEQLSIIKANREQREQKAQDDAEDYALEVEKTATLLAMRIERDALEKNKNKERMKDKNELTHKAPSLIRQFKN
jgi:hypothetical protein